MADPDPDLIDVIDRTALIENLLNQVIQVYCIPRKDRFMFFRDVVLHSSIMPLGSKVKVAMAIAQQLHFKLDNNALHNVIALRNAFAQHETSSHPVFVVGKTVVEDELHFQLQVISSSGRITRTKRHDAHAQLVASYQAAKISLVALLEKIRSNDSQEHT